MDDQDMDAVRRFQTLASTVLSFSPGQIPENLLLQMSQILNSGAHIPKQCQKILTQKLSNTSNKAHIINIMEVERYLVRNSGLEFYLQISSKQFLQTIQTILEKNMNQVYVCEKIREAVQTSREVFQPYKTQLYFFYQFYENNATKFNGKKQNFIPGLSSHNSARKTQRQNAEDQNNNKIQFDINQQAKKFQNQFRRISAHSIGSTSGVVLFKTIFSCYRCQLTLFFILCIITSGTFIAISMLGYKLIEYRQEGNQNTSTNLMYFFIYIILYLFLSFSHHYTSFISFRRCYKINAILILMIFNKITRYPLLSDKTFQTAQIINTIQIDSQFFIYMNYYVKVLSYILFQIVLGFGLLFGYIGISVFTGLGTLIVFTITNGILFYLIANVSKKLQKAQDARIKVAEQILRIIRFIKINTLQKYFLQNIQEKRQNEIKLKQRIGLIKAFSNKFLNGISSFLVVAVILLVYLHKENQVKVSEAFLIVIIFKNIQAVLQNLPDKITYLILVWISAQKIQKFLLAKQIKKVQDIIKNDSHTAIQIVQGEFLWQSNQKKENSSSSKINKQFSNVENPPSASHLFKGPELSCERIQQQDNKIMIKGKPFIKLLSHINLRLHSKQLTMIIGDVGSGKSSLLFAILGEMATRQQSHQSVQISGSIAYCPQKPWIINGTVRENIILGNAFQETRFRESVYYACLDKDIQLLQNGIETEIGEKGVNLSGGQKVRINLARALYANKDIYLLDDILSAVDVNVGQFLMQKTIKTFLSGKTVIMPTHSIKFLHQAHNLIIMNKGNIVQQGSYSKVSQSQHFVRIVSLLEQKKKQISNRQQMKNNKSQERFNRNIEILQKNTKEIVEEDKKVIQSLIISQKQQTINISRETYIQFFRFSGGKKFIFGVILLLIIKTSLEILSNIWLQKWCLDENRSTFYLYMYLGFGILSSIILGILSLFLMFSQNSQNRKIFSKVVNSILPASLNQFFNRVPQGRLLNRLGKDFAQIDDLITNMLQSLFGPFLSVISILVIAVYISTFYLFIPIVFVAIFWIWKYKKLIKIQKKLFIIKKLNISLIISEAIQLIDGIDSIRAYKLHKYFFQKHLKQLNMYVIQELKRIRKLSQYFVKVALVSCSINFTALGYCIFAFSDSSTQIGLLFAYTGFLMQEISAIAYWLAEFQCRMISVQRILKLNQIEPENGYNLDKEHKNRTKLLTPNPGQIVFSNYSSQYQKHLPLILKNINITIKKGQKVGVVGRTGAGKSSMFNCLLRILEPVEGSLTINGKQVRQYEVRDLRESITMIDQEATLIKGTFRQNLDPYDKFSDQQIISTLKECNLYNIVQDKGGLNSQVSNNSLSVGQKQLMCICRSMLTKNSIVLIDEATANIDVNNDYFIQQVIRKMFSTSTIITIAHRLSTIQDYDKILVLSQGRVIQWGDTKQLLKDKSSIYHQMCERNDQSYLC